jgi:hypothetical protein
MAARAGTTSPERKATTAFMATKVGTTSRVATATTSSMAVTTTII